MKTVVNEPQVEYIAGRSWQSGLKKRDPDLNICGIEDGTLLLFSPNTLINAFIWVKPKKKLSALRGKLTKKQSKDEIDEQISILRNEWNRNI